MFEKLKKLSTNFLDFFLPRRKDFLLVENLNFENISLLPKALPIADLDWIHPLFAYKENRVRAIIWELKYKKNFLPLEHIGKLMYEEIMALISDILLFNNDAKFLLIPIPISTERRMERGYNQSEQIAKAILEHDLEHILLYAPQWFLKIKDTPKQSLSQSKERRLENLSGCFSANPRVLGKYVILVDDVITTGSTLSESRKTLSEAGVQDVLAFTIAH